MNNGKYNRKKTFYVTFQRDMCDVVCSCHLLEFREIVCRHAISVLFCNDIMTLPDRYILRRWKRDVSRAYTRVVVHYDGLVSTPAQLTYDRMCKSFATLANMTTDDNEETRSIIEWIEKKTTTVMTTRSSGGSNVLPSRVVQVVVDCSSAHTPSSDNMQDTTCSKRKGTPKKLRKKSALESIKGKVCLGFLS